MGVTLLRVVRGFDEADGGGAAQTRTTGKPSSLSGWSGSIMGINPVPPVIRSMYSRLPISPETTVRQSKEDDVTSTSDRAVAQHELEPAGAAGQSWVPPTWEEIVTQHSARVYRLAYRLTGNMHDAEDLTHDVF